jgi:hypothetical protein
VESFTPYSRREMDATMMREVDWMERALEHQRVYEVGKRRARVPLVQRARLQELLDQRHSRERMAGRDKLAAWAVDQPVMTAGSKGSHWEVGGLAPRHVRAVQTNGSTLVTATSATVRMVATAASQHSGTHCWDCDAKGECRCSGLETQCWSTQCWSEGECGCSGLGAQPQPAGHHKTSTRLRNLRRVRRRVQTGVRRRR